jgi:hypothetical protein
MRGSLAGGSRVSRQPYIAQHGARPSVALGRASLLNLCPPAGPVRGRRGVGVRVCALIRYREYKPSGRPRGIGLDAASAFGGYMRRSGVSRSRHRTICRLTRAAVNVTHLHSSQPPGAANAFTSTRRTAACAPRPPAPNKRRRTRAESRGAPRRAGRALIHTDHSHDMPVGGSAPGGSHLVVHRNSCQSMHRTRQSAFMPK